MGAATALPVRELQVEPGQTTTAKMLVRNTGQVVDQYTIDVVGACAEWTQVEPKVVNLLPGADVEVTVTFAPARDPHVAAGVVPFGLRVLSREDPPGSTVAEGTIEVAAFDDVQVELVPRASRGRRRARHQVAIDNNGNQPATVEVSAQDEEEALDFKFDHRMASIEPGAAAFIKMHAKPEKRFFKGADRQHPFIVTVAPSTPPPIAARGTMTQKQLLPSWLIPVVAAALILALVAFVLYETLIKQQINATAKDAAAKVASSVVASAISSVGERRSERQRQRVHRERRRPARRTPTRAPPRARPARPTATPTPPTSNGNNGNNNGNTPPVASARVASRSTTARPRRSRCRVRRPQTPGNFTSFGITDGPAHRRQEVPRDHRDDHAEPGRRQRDDGDPPRDRVRSCAKGCRTSATRTSTSTTSRSSSPTPRRSRSR